MKDQHESVITPRDMAAIKWAAAVIGILLFVLGVTSGSFGLAFGVGMMIICVMAPAFAAGLIVRRRKPIPVEYKVVAVVFLLSGLSWTASASKWRVPNRTVLGTNPLS